MTRDDQDPWAAADPVETSVTEMLSSPEALLEGIARTDAGPYAGPDGDAEFARFLAEQPDRTLSQLGRALLGGERLSALVETEQFGPLLRRGVEQLERTDGHDVVRVVAENDRALRRP